MPKKILYCDDCCTEFTVTYKGNEPPKFCPFCSAELELDWHSSEEEDD